MTAVAALRGAEPGVARAAATADSHAAAGLTAGAFVVLTVPDAFGFTALLPMLAVLLLAAGHLLLRTGRSLGALTVPVSVAAVGAWLIATTLTSTIASVTLVRASTVAAVLLLGCLLGSVAGGRALLTGIVLGGVVIVLVSLVVAAAAPGTGLMPAGYQGGALRGLYSHRNVLAEVLWPTVLAALVVRFRGRWHRARWWAATTVVLAGLLLTRASTALVSLAVVVAVVVVLAIGRGAPRAGRALLLVAAVVLAGVMGLLVGANSTLVLGLLGRDGTLTSRTPIWAAVSSLVAQHPVVGWGWNATWEEGDLVRQTVSAAVGFDVPSAHNGYLDLLLQAGVVGLILFGLLLAGIAGRGVVGYLATGDRFAQWAIALVIGLLVYDGSESSALSFTSILLLGATATVLVRAGRRSRAASDG